MTRLRAIVGTLILLVTCGAGASDDAAAVRSPALASELTGLLAAAGLDAVAAADPDNPDRFVAALAVPKVQLLVVDARAPAPETTARRIAARQYRDVYTELQQREATEGRIFVYDMGANGLQREGGDVLYESGTVQTVFNGEPASQKLSDSTYRQRVADTDQRYSRMLNVLIDALKRSPGL
jgi:hypothetical protein